jgi:hypothetical protein
MDAPHDDRRTSDVGPMGRRFATCVGTPRLGVGWANPPIAIAEVIEVRGGFGASCHCSGTGAYVTRRFMCGAFDHDAGAATPACSPPYPSPPAILLIRSQATCGQATYWGHTLPMSEWDGILAEQIAGHSDAGDGGIGTPHPINGVRLPSGATTPTARSDMRSTVPSLRRARSCTLGIECFTLLHAPRADAACGPPPAPSLFWREWELPLRRSARRRLGNLPPQTRLRGRAGGSRRNTASGSAAGQQGAQQG